jgi:cobalt-zinc-cadmium efflux system outer membrane protein
MNAHSRRLRNSAVKLAFLALLVAFLAAFSRVEGRADESLNLDELIAEGLQKSPEILAAQARAQAAGFRIPQAKSLPDPMFMFGYQNEGFDRINVGEQPNANSEGMFSLSQQFYYPGKRALKGEMASKDALSLAAMVEQTKLEVASKIKQLYYSLFLSYKTIDILKENADLYARIDDAAASRYASGMGAQEEVVMAQTEKYMLLEKEEMERQKIEALQGMLNATVGREATSPLRRPVLSASTPFDMSLNDALFAAQEHSPEIRSKKQMVEGARTKIKMAQKEYYPDFAIAAGYFPRGGAFPPMWNLTATVNLPIFSKTKQSQALAEARMGLAEAERELHATELMVSSNMRDAFSMLDSAGRLMKLYKEGLVPKASQDVELAFTGYATGKAEALTVITRIRNLLDVDLLYWTQFVEREKAIARLHEASGIGAHEAPGKNGRGEEER